MDDAVDRPPPLRGRIALALVLILAVAAIARFTGLEFGLAIPYARPDENRVAGYASKMLEGEWSPRSFAYPALFPMLSAGARLGLELAAPDSDPSVPPHVAGYLASRIVSACAGVATVALLFLLVRRLRGAGEALIAALLLALCHLHSRDSHFGVTDTTLALATTGALLLFVRSVDWPRWRRFAWCGVAIGVAAAVKQPAVWLAVPLLIEAFRSAPDDATAAGASPWRRRLTLGIGSLLLAGTCAATTFLLLNPHALIEPSRFLADVRFEFENKTAANARFAERGWVTHASFTLLDGLGAPVAVLALIGLLITTLRESRGTPIVVAFALAWYLGMGSGTRGFARYMLPLTPIAALFAARAITAMGSSFLPARARAASIAIAALAIAAPSTARIVATDRLLRARDSRELAADHLRAHLAEGERALWIGRYSWPFPPGFDARIDLQDGKPLQEELPPDADPAAVLRAAGYSWVVIADHWLDSQFDLPEELLAQLEPALEPAAAFGPLAAGRTREDVAPRFDRRDLLYLPYSGFDGFARPGPFVQLFRVRR
ncbi:MAG: phospholipid carrier-dependent glycosyltransferase [Planctomycetes bacterium]|nr:phospholipid carrier-dependent glycosyltransferase [Planctomycetota bacterium]